MTGAEHGPAPGAEIGSGTLCLRCGYDLRELDADDRCPECGLAIADSVRGPRLVYAEPAYVRTLARGALLAEFGAIAYLFTSCLGGLVVSLFFGSAARVAGASLSTWIGTATTIVLLLGLWLLASPDPALRAHVPGTRSRLWLRRVIPLAAFGSAASALSVTIVSLMPIAGATSNTLLSVAAAVGMGAMVATGLLSMSYAAALNLRAGDRLRANFARGTRSFGAWVLVAALILLVVGSIASAFTRIGSLQVLGIGMGFAVFMGVLGLLIAAFVWAIFYIVALEQLRSSLAQVRDLQSGGGPPGHREIPPVWNHDPPRASDDPARSRPEVP